MAETSQQIMVPIYALAFRTWKDGDGTEPKPVNPIGERKLVNIAPATHAQLIAHLADRSEFATNFKKRQAEQALAEQKEELARKEADARHEADRLNQINARRDWVAAEARKEHDAAVEKFKVDQPQEAHNAEKEQQEEATQEYGILTKDQARVMQLEAQIGQLKQEKRMLRERIERREKRQK